MVQFFELNQEQKNNTVRERQFKTVSKQLNIIYYLCFMCHVRVNIKTVHTR